MNQIAVTIQTNRQTTIKSCIAENKRHLIQVLTVIGSYQSEYDNDTIRYMCNCLTENGVRSGGQLEVLNLENAEIMSRYSAGYRANSGSLYSSNSLNDCITLREIKLGKSLTSISGRDLSGCISLEKISVVDNPIYVSINGILYQYADNSDWTTSTRTQFGDGKWILIKVPASIQDSTLIKFEKVNQIAPNAFENTRLRTLIMGHIPPVCDSSAFSKEDISKITIFVPAESFNSYWCHPIWGQFNIQIIKQ